jgi:hypothetical protein
MSLDVIFATIVGVLAGLAVIGALAFVLGVGVVRYPPHPRRQPTPRRGAVLA